MKCIIAAGIIGSMIYHAVNIKNTDVFINFENTLQTEEHKILWKKVVNEREQIYIHSIILAIIVGIIYYIMFNYNYTTFNICISIILMKSVQYLYYYFHPKSFYFLEKIANKDINQAWFQIYRFMKLNCIIGFLLGITGYILFQYSLVDLISN